jgi:hypothetical protein
MNMGFNLMLVRTEGAGFSTVSTLFMARGFSMGFKILLVRKYKTVSIFTGGSQLHDGLHFLTGSQL